MTDAWPAFEQRRGGAPALLFLHGIGGDASSFAPQLDHFAPRHHVVAWTMPGYGASPALPEMTFASLADAAVRLLDRLELDRAVVVGHSMGGMVALEMTASHGDRVAGLVLACTTAAFGPSGSDFAEKFLGARLKPLDEGKTPADLAPALVAAMIGETAPPGAREAAAAAMARIAPDAYRAALHCLVTFDRRDALATIACPTLALAGSEDKTAPAEVMERMASRIPGGSYACLDGAGHIANQEAPDAFNAAIDGFLAALEAA